MLLSRVLSCCKNIRPSATTAAWNYSTKKGPMDNTSPFTSADSSPFEKKKMENQTNIAEKLPKTVPVNQYNHLENKQLSEMLSTQVSVPVPWGNVKCQVFGDPTKKNAKPILSIHGYLDNSNSFKPVANYMCQDEYFIIAIDLPGHGLSSPLPQGIPYTPKLFLNAIRRVVKHFELDKRQFMFLNHSYGCILGFLYDTVFQGEVTANLCIDWILGYRSRKWASYAFYWKEGIDHYMKADEKKLSEPSKKQREPLTPERATKILMKSNHHLDESAAKLLIERALTQKEDGTFDFSRDINVKVTMSVRDHYVDIAYIWPEIRKSLTAPVLVIHAKPASYGEQSLTDTLDLCEQINQESQTSVQLKTFDGTHHFHMINPRETACLLFEFLDSLKSSPSTKL